MSEVNIFASEVSKLSAGARILRGPKGPEILVDYMTQKFLVSLPMVNILEEK